MGGILSEDGSSLMGGIFGGRVQDPLDVLQTSDEVKVAMVLGKAQKGSAKAIANHAGMELSKAKEALNTLKERGAVFGLRGGHYTLEPGVKACIGERLSKAGKVNLRSAHWDTGEENTDPDLLAAVRGKSEIDPRRLARILQGAETDGKLWMK